MEMVGFGVLPPNPTDLLKLELLTGARCGEISAYKSRRLTPVSGFGRCPVHARKMPALGDTNCWDDKADLGEAAV